MGPTTDGRCFDDMLRWENTGKRRMIVSYSKPIVLTLKRGGQGRDLAGKQEGKGDANEAKAKDA